MNASLADLALYDEVITIFLEHLHVTAPSLDADLLASCVLNPPALAKLLVEFEIRYGIRTSLEQIDFDDFRSVASISAFIARERNND
jgi:hypothetical protein